MNRDKIIRAWKDEDYRASLSEEERSAMPGHPAGAVELSDADLHAAGGTAEAFTGVHCVWFSVEFSCVPFVCENTIFNSTCGAGGVTAGCCRDHEVW